MVNNIYFSFNDYERVLMIFKQCDVSFFLQNLDNLMVIELDCSKYLIEIPDLSKAPKLEKVSLLNCESLCQLHPSIFSAPKLKSLYLKGCKKIEKMKTNIHSKSLETLDLSECSSLVEFSVTSDAMTTLFLRGTAIHELSSSIWRNRKLNHLFLSECKKLSIVGKKLLNDPAAVPLQLLDLSGCTQIDTLNLWYILDGLQSLKDLNLRECCNLETLPNNIQNNSMLVTLNLDECTKLKSQPKLSVSLQELTAFNCIYLNTDSILRSMLENVLQRYLTNSEDIKKYLYELPFLPGANVLSEFDFHTIEASIVIPPIPKSGLYCFVFCVILSEGLDVKYNSVRCTVYEYKKEVYQCYVGGRRGELISDHVVLQCWCDNYKLF